MEKQELLTQATKLVVLHINTIEYIIKSIQMSIEFLTIFKNNCSFLDTNDNYHN